MRHSGFRIFLFGFQSFCFFSQNIFLSWDWGARGESFLPLQKTSFISWAAFFFAPMNIFLHLSSLFFDVEVDPLAVIRSHCFRAVRTYAPLRFGGLADGLIVSLILFCRVVAWGLSSP